MAYMPADMVAPLSPHQLQVVGDVLTDWLVKARYPVGTVEFHETAIWGASVYRVCVTLLALEGEPARMIEVYWQPWLHTTMRSALRDLYDRVTEEDRHQKLEAKLSSPGEAV